MAGGGRFYFNAVNVLLGVFLLLLSILLIALLPELLALRLGRVVINWSRLVILLKDFFLSLKEGTFFYYKSGLETRNFLYSAAGYMRTSFLYITAAGVLAVFLGIPLGIKATQRGFVAGKYILKVINLFGSLPDFVTFVLLQLFVILFNSLTGVRLARIASDGLNPAVFLPLLAMSIYPLLYITRITALEAEKLRGENFVLALKGRGVPQSRILFRHLLPGILKPVERDLPRVFGIIMASLFIAERIFNLSGITRFFFTYAFVSARGIRMVGYQYNVAVLSLLSLILVFLAAYGLSLSVILAADRILSHE